MLPGIFAEPFARPSAANLRRPLLLVLLLIGVCPGAALSQASVVNPCAPQLARPQDQLWLVNARGVGCAPYAAAPTALRYWHYLPGVGWQASSAAEFFASDDPATITQIWIHGNQIESSGAFQVGWTVYTALARRAASEQPLRFVIWSWPSEKVGRMFQDVREKAARTTPAAFPLARFIGAIQVGAPVNIIGYSYGARIALGALQLLAGGPLGGRTLPAEGIHARPAAELVLIAAAVDCGALWPGCQFGKALSVVDRLLLVNNGCDQALRFYRFIYGRRCGVEALGYVGLGYANRLGADGANISQFDACCLVGSEHYWANYFASPTIVNRLQPFIFGPAAAAPASSASRETAAAPKVVPNSVAKAGA